MGILGLRPLVFFTCANGSDVGRVSATFVCLSVCFSVRCIKKTDAARITNPDAEFFHRESWKRIYVWGQKVKVTRDNKHCRHGTK